MVEALKKKGERRSLNPFVTIFVVIVLVAILTWIIPGGSYQLDDAGNAIAGTYQRVAANPQGLWDIFMAPIIGMVGNDMVGAAIAVSLNVMFFSAFLEMIDTSGALTTFLKRIAVKNKGQSTVLICLLVAVMMVLGTVTGSYEEGFVFLLIFLPILIGMGLDTITALAVVVVGTQMGCLASVINPFSVGIASEIAGISPGDGMLLRAALLALGYVFACFFICRYANRVQKDPSKSLQAWRRAEDVAEFGGEEGGGCVGVAGGAGEGAGGGAGAGEVAVAGGDGAGGAGVG
ncbi:MAG: hypothetical protein LBJ07_02390, partial [Actinomycetes bacterium]|nr:hypothetical protein [Actinomycetes bacterium]